MLRPVAMAPSMCNAASNRVQGSVSLDGGGDGGVDSCPKGSGVVVRVCASVAANSINHAVPQGHEEPYL